MAGNNAGKQGVVRVVLTRVSGSAPREAGAEMLVFHDGIDGTIGGGQLEFMAIDRARQMLKLGQMEAEMDVPLGPEIGQCCGGRVTLDLTRMSADDMAARERAVQEARAERPAVLIFGAGHVGRALARALVPLPLNARLIDSRESELAQAGAGETSLTALPESEIHTAPNGAAFVIATHDHALDFLLAAEALKRRDAAYVGMIGSRTKRARFLKWLQDVDREAPGHGLTCPIGADGLGDKRPEVIAAHVAAELLRCFAQRENIRMSMETKA